MASLSRWFGILLLCGLTACATSRPLARNGLPDAVHLAHVPFYAQQDHWCGPASLAMVMAYAGSTHPPRELAPLLYVPGRKGSLQVEMQALPRRFGLFVYPLQDGLPELFAQLVKGMPVLVMQNLGLSFAPRWHYAVVTGYDLKRGRIMLHTGEQADDAIPIDIFARTWQRAGNWAMVVLPAGAMPADAQRDRYLRAAVALEGSGQAAAAERAYQSATRRWPDSFIAWMGLGNSRYTQGKDEMAIAAWRQAARIRPDHAAPWHNIAQAAKAKGDAPLFAHALAMQRDHVRSVAAGQ